jgi:hypothetical protein
VAVVIRPRKAMKIFFEAFIICCVLFQCAKLRVFVGME